MDGDHRISGRRAAENQSLYRSINEKVKELNETFAETGIADCEWICECADTECTRHIPASLHEYETVRSNPRTFIVFPGHLLPHVERVFDENNRFLVVEKIDNAGVIAEALDPRQTRPDRPKQEARLGQ